MTTNEIIMKTNLYRAASSSLDELREQLLDPGNPQPLEVYITAVRRRVISRSEVWAVIEELYERDQLSELPTIWAVVAVAPDLVPPDEMRRAVNSGTCQIGYVLDGFKKLQGELEK